MATVIISHAVAVLSLYSVCWRSGHRSAEVLDQYQLRAALVDLRPKDRAPIPRDRECGRGVGDLLVNRGHVLYLPCRERKEFHGLVSRARGIRIVVHKKDSAIGNAPKARMNTVHYG